MVSCKVILEHMSEYMDGETSSELCHTIEGHLRRCRKCNAVYDSTRKLLVIIADERTFELPAGFSEKLHHFIDRVIVSDSCGGLNA